MEAVGSLPRGGDLGDHFLSPWAFVRKRLSPVSSCWGADRGVQPFLWGASWVGHPALSLDGFWGAPSTGQEWAVVVEAFVD